MNQEGSSVFACESQPIVIEGLQKVLSGCPDLRFAGAALTRVEALPCIENGQPDVLLVDQSGGLKATLQFMAEARRLSPRSQPVLWVSELAEVESLRALQYGARGILKKTLAVATLLECLRAVANGNVWIENSISDQVAGFLNRRATPRLTAREREIVNLVCQGLRNRQIAEELAITPGTVKVHLMHVFEKTGVKDRFELAIRGRRLGELERDGELVDAREAPHG